MCDCQRHSHRTDDENYDDPQIVVLRLEKPLEINLNLKITYLDPAVNGKIIMGQVSQKPQ